MLNARLNLLRPLFSDADYPAIRVPSVLPTQTTGGRTSLTLPELRDYELIELTRAAPSTVRK